METDQLIEELFSDIFTLPGSPGFWSPYKETEPDQANVFDLNSLWKCAIMSECKIYKICFGASVCIVKKTNKNITLTKK